MATALIPVTALLLSVALLLMGNGLLGTLLPVRANLESFSTFDIGVLGSSYYVGFAAGCLLGPYLVRRVGHIRTFTAMVSLASAVALAHALILNPLLWWGFRAVTGFCFAVLYMVIESWLNEKSTNENRGFIFSVYTIINLTVITIGQMMLPLGSPTAFPLFVVASILVSLAALPVALTKAQAPAPIATVKIRIRHLYESSPVGFASALGVGLVNGSFWSLGPVFAQGNSTASDTMAVAIFMSTAVIAGAIGQWPLGRMSDKIDRRKVIVAACLGAAIAGLGITLFSDKWPQAIFAFSILYGIFAFPLYALSAAHMNDSVEPGGFIEASSGLLLLFAFGAVVGPLIASVAMRFFEPQALFLYTAVVHIAMAIFAICRMRQSARPHDAEREPFADSVLVAHTIAAIDPLSDVADEDNAETSAVVDQPS